MEIREFACRVLLSEDLGEKLRAPRGELTDSSPRPEFGPRSARRSAALTIVPASLARVPSAEGLHDPSQQPRILHALANHELQAAELFAWALLKFWVAPAEFRAGLARILIDEQRHTRMYRRRLQALGSDLGRYPVSGYFWNKARHIETPCEFVCAMSLTFENANLDHTVEYSESARRAGDLASARLIERIERDEIEHVRFGWEWLNRFKARDQDPWEAYRATLRPPLTPERARGRTFHREGRLRAGLDEEFIRRLEVLGTRWRAEH